MRSFIATGAATVFFTAVLATGCNRDSLQGSNPGGPPDMIFVFPDYDAGDIWVNDAGVNPQLTPCGDTNPSCTIDNYGPPYNVPFTLPPDPDAQTNTVSKDKNGFLELDLSAPAYDFAWTANTADWGRGTISKFNTTTVRELARYFSVTCHSLPTGNRNQCDGQNGCCANDSYPQWQNRQQKKPDGPYQQVEMTHVNYPSRTAIDFDGTMWVSNRALYQQGAQSSVTKIEPEVSRCKDFNKNGVIDTSRDVNGDGVIQTDCNGNGIPDDIADVKQAKCINGMEQEFYGLDDECVILTTNTGGLDGWGRPLALGPGAKQFGPSDPWAGLFNTGQVFRIDGGTGKIKEETKVPGQPYGFAIDATGIGWCAYLGPAGCFWDTNNVQSTGSIRQSNLGQSSYGIGLDRDQNIWFGGTAARYTPLRNGKFSDLGNGNWTVFQGINGSGVAVDNRSKAAYFAYFAGDKLYQVPASTIPLPNGQDVSVAANAFPAVMIDQGGKGVDIAVDGNVVTTSQSVPGLTRVKVDAKGVMTQPVLNGMPMGNNLCPTGDNCHNTDRMNADMQPYTYSDFTGYGLRNFSLPQGSYSFIQPGCLINGVQDGETKWFAIGWDATVPPNTSFSVRARSGNTPIPDQSWGDWTPSFTVSPADLTGGKALMPNAMGSSYLQVEFDMATMAKDMSPILKSFYIMHECIGGLG
jgi:hypothetical protein